MESSQALVNGPPEFTLYEPPKSACFGQGARVTSARGGWAQVADFFSCFTSASLDSPVVLSVVLPFSGPVTVFNQYRAHVNQAMGTGGEGRWEFPPEQLERALALVFDEERWPRQPDGPAQLNLRFRFDWRLPLTIGEGQALPQSTLGVSIGGQRVFLQPLLWFPWACSDPALRPFLWSIAEKVPFQLRENCFRRWVPTKAGGYRALRMPEGWSLKVMS